MTRQLKCEDAALLTSARLWAMTNTAPEGNFVSWALNGLNSINLAEPGIERRISIWFLFFSYKILLEKKPWLANIAMAWSIPPPSVPMYLSLRAQLSASCCFVKESWLLWAKARAVAQTKALELDKPALGGIRPYTLAFIPFRIVCGSVVFSTTPWIPQRQYLNHWGTPLSILIESKLVCK